MIWMHISSERMIDMELNENRTSEDRKVYVTEMFEEIANNVVDDIRKEIESSVGNVVGLVGIRLGEIGEDWFDIDGLYNVLDSVLILATFRIHDDKEGFELVDMRVVKKDELE